MLLYKNDFWPNTYWFILSYSFQAFVWLRGLTIPRSSGMTIYRNTLGQFWTLNIRLETFWSHCLVVSVKCLGHSGPSWVSAAPSSGHLDPLTIPLSFFRESKVLLASTIIVFEDTSCLLMFSLLLKELIFLFLFVTILARSSSFIKRKRDVYFFHQLSIVLFSHSY